MPSYNVYVYLIQDMRKYLKELVRHACAVIQFVVRQGILIEQSLKSIINRGVGIMLE